MWVPALMLQTNFELFHKKFKSRSMIQFCHVLSEQEAQSTQFSLHGPKQQHLKNAAVDLRSFRIHGMAHLAIIIFTNSS